MPIVELLFDLKQDFYNASCVWTGLDMLARAGVIRLRLHRVDPSLSALTADPLTVCMRIHGRPSAEPVLVAVDLRDQSDQFAVEAMKRCDAYLKRSFSRTALSALPGHLALKVQPFGLNYPCRSWGSGARLFSVGLRMLTRGATGIRSWKYHVTLPTVSAFEQDPSVLLEPTIVFQTRVWDPHDTAPGECDTINEGRVSIIRALRKAFGQRFRGGLVPTELARARYPREITTYPTRRNRYTAMSKRSLIGVYTVGLHRSTAFKLPEYLAASQCVVAEPLFTELPTPLMAGTHYIPFSSPDECVAACGRLLDDPGLADQMRRANHEYYVTQVAPAAQMLRALRPHLATVPASK